MRPGPRGLYAWSASVLLVSLGLGVIYLVVMERLSLLAGLAGLALGMGLLAVLAALREEIDEADRSEQFLHYSRRHVDDELRERGDA